MNISNRIAQNVTTNLWIILGVLLVGVVAALAAAVSITSTKILVITLLSITLGLTFLLSGNIRLFALYSMIFLAPWTIKKDFYYLGHMSGAVSFDLHISDPFLLLMIAFQLRDVVRGKIGNYRFPRALYLWIALIALGLWSVVFNPMFLPPAHEAYRMTRLLLWMLVLANEVVRHKQFLHAAYALLIAAAVQAAFAYLQVLGIDFGLESYGQMTVKGMQDLGASTLSGERGVARISGLMTHPNVLGPYLALSAGVAMALVFSPVNSFVKAAATVLLLGFAVIILLTLSRAAWADFAVVVFGMILLTNTNAYSRKRYMALRTWVISGLLIVGIASSGVIIKRMTQSAPESVGARWNFVEAASKMVAEKPWFGYGLNNYTFYQPPFTKFGSYNSMIDAHGPAEDWPVVHNSYLLVWVEQGTVGLVIWMWLHIAVIRIGVRNLRIRDPTLHALNVAFLVGFIAIMVDGLVSFFDRLQQGIFIWIYASFIFSLAYWRYENDSVSSLEPELKSVPQVSQAPLRLGFTRPSSNGGWLPSGTAHQLGSSQSKPKLSGSVSRKLGG
ncbi:MAG: putative inorganic carbon (HCO3(-)) transporter [Candidatus Azotimanducaceae bacterium]|jgi:hypothetical protein